MMKLNWFILSVLGVICLSIMSFLITFMAKKGFPVSYILMGIGIIFVVYYFAQTFIFSSQKFSITPLSVLVLLIIGLLSAVGNLFVYQATTMAPNAGLPLAIAGMQSVIVSLLAFLIFKDKLTALQIVGIVFAIISIFLINIGSSGAKHDQSAKVVNTTNSK